MFLEVAQTKEKIENFRSSRHSSEMVSATIKLAQEAKRLGTYIGYQKKMIGGELGRQEGRDAKGD